MNERIKAARAALEAATTRMHEAANAVEQLTAADAEPTDEQLDTARGEFDTAEAENERCKKNLAYEERVAKARTDNPLPVLTDTDEEGEARDRPIRTGKEEPVYRQDNQHVQSFFRDVMNWKHDPLAMGRLMRHQAQAIDERKLLIGRQLVEARDVTTADPGAAGFIPPVYLAELAVLLPRAGRPFADVCTGMPLPEMGNSLTVPKVQSGVTVAVQAAEGDAVSETDIDTQTVTVSVRTIAGQNDLTIQALERSFPGMDQIVLGDLLGAYDETLDTQLLAGTGSNGQHLGIRAVSGVTAKSYTDSSPTAAECLPRIADTVQAIATALKRGYADTIVWHPRRAAWMVSSLSSTFPLFPLAGTVQALGAQDRGFPVNPLGFEQVVDANIAVTRGASTNEDEVYIVRAADLILMEGPLRVRTHEQTLGGNLITRIQLFAFSAFASARRPEAIGVLSGTGLATPSFT